jgi:outer membrane immunogenic protein
MKTKIVGLALLASISGAVAADLPQAAPAAYSKSPVLAAAYNWTGFYIGAMGGYGWSQNFHSGGAVTNTNDLKGGFAGGTVGYNWQAPGSQFVFGLEVDAAWSDLAYREAFILGTTLEDRIRSMGSVTGRVGFAADAALFYVKGGYAWADNRLALLNAANVALFSESRFHSGWTIGGGLEYGFTPNWSAKAEYMYSSFSDSNYLSAFTPGGVALGMDIHTAKVGVNYRFGGGPVVARY